MNIIEVVVLAAGGFYVGANLGERLCLVIDKVVHKKELEPGCVYFHRTTRETVVIDSVIPGGLFKKSRVEFLAGNKRLQVELGEFFEQFKYAQYSVRGE